MYDVILVRYGEIGLKGQNRSFFVNKLISNIKKAIQKIANFNIKKTPGRIFIYPEQNYEQILEKLKMIPGIVSVSPTITAELDYDELEKSSLELFKKEVTDFPTTFKVKTNRPNKSFPKNSMEVNRDIGAYILDNYSEDQLSVDIHNPEHSLNFDIRNDQVYIFTRTISGPGGLPVGSSGKGLLLLSGGIDSPVAGWQAMTRGMELEAIYFHSPPYTSERAKEKVMELARILSQYGTNIKLHLSHFTEIQRAIKQKCDKQFTITIMRRMMYRIATKIAQQNQNQVLLTGESIGQVSSQTLENISTISSVTNMPILRPLITIDKQEIIKMAKKIGTYKTSIQPYEDCCTIFVPNHPVTKPTLAEAKANEADLEIEKLVKSGVENTQFEIS